MKTKVLIFIDWFSPGYKAGGPITSNVNITAHLKDVFDFYVVTSAYDYHCDEPYEGIAMNEWVERDGVRVYYFDKKMLSYYKLKKLAAEVGCDVWYINGVYSKYFSIMPLFLAKCLNPKKVIVSARGMLSPHALAVNGKVKTFYLYAADIIGLYKGVVFHATNEEEASYIRDMFFSKSNVIAIENLPRKLEIQSVENKHKLKGEIRLVSFARISPEKNTLFAIRALKNCKMKVRYDIYGQVNSKDYWNQCKEEITQLPENVIVEYKGCVDPNEMITIYKNYDMLYLPTTGENFGHAILESFINGCPVVISDKTPWRKLAEKRIGWDLPLAEDEFSRTVDNAATLDDDDYHMMCQCTSTFAKGVLANNEIKEKYIRLFMC